MIVYGYHGTLDIYIPDIFKNGFRKSPRSSLWLGHGAYFFQDGPERALNWAKALAVRMRVKPVPVVCEARVLKAAIDLSNSIDWFDMAHLDQIATLSTLWQQGRQFQQHPFSTNFMNPRPEKLGWNFDDHEFWEFVQLSYTNSKIDFDSIRMPFAEGTPIHRTSWIFDESSAIINIKNRSAIKSLIVI
jgi:hypothetical protein